MFLSKIINQSNFQGKDAWSKCNTAMVTAVHLLEEIFTWYLTSKLFSDADKLNPQLNKFLTTHWLNESVSLNNLFFPVSVDDGVQAFKCSATHQVTNAFLLYTEPLDLIVDVEEEWVVAGRVVAGSH